MPRSRSSSRCFGGGKSRPYAACSRSHQPAPTPTKARPPVSTSSVAAALAVMPGARNVTGVTRVPSSRPVPRPATAPRVTHGSGIEAQARSTCGIWMRWSITDSPANPASSAARATPVSQAKRILAPREPADLEHHLEPLRRAAAPRRPGRSPGRRARLSAGSSDADRVHDVPALELQLRDQCAVPLELAGQGRRRHRPVPGGVAAPALGIRRVHHHGHGGQPDLSRPGQPAPAPVLVGAEGVDDGGQPAAGAGGHHALEQVEGVRGRVEVVRPAADHPAQGVGGHDLVAAVAALRPRGLPRAGRADEDDERRVGKRHTRLWPNYGRTMACWAAEAAASRRERSWAWPAGRASPSAAAGRCCEPRRQVTGCCSAPVRARAAATSLRFEGVNVVGLLRIGAAHPRHDLVAEASERRAGQRDDPVRGAASEPQAGADAAGQDRARVHLSPRSRSRARTSWPGLLRRGLLRGWPSSSAVFLAAVFLAVAFLRPSWPGSSWQQPSSLESSSQGGRRRLLTGRRRPCAEPSWPAIDPFGPPIFGGHGAHCGGGLADRPARRPACRTDGVLHGLADRVDHGRDGDVRDDLDRAERVLRGH